MKKYLLALLLFMGAMTFSAHAGTEPGAYEGPVSPQVGMYSYRTDTLTGMTSKDCEGNIKKKIVIERDPSERIIRKIHYHPDGRVKLICAYEFSPDGRLMAKIKQSPDGNAISTLRYTYDEQKRLIGQTDFSGDGKMKKRHVYCFNEFGERIQKTTYDAEGRLTETKVYVFDGRNRRIQDYALSSGGTIIGSTRYLEDKTAGTERIEYLDDKFETSSYSVISLDAAGRRKKNERFAPDGSLKSSLEYHYE